VRVPLASGRRRVFGRVGGVAREGRTDAEVRDYVAHRIGRSRFTSVKRKIRTRVLLSRGFVPRDQTAAPAAVTRIPVIGRENRATAARSMERCGRSWRPRATMTRGQTCFGVSDSSHRDTKVVATVRASVRGEGQLLACFRYASHRGRCVGVHAFAEENVRTRDLDVNLTKSLPERGVETFWVLTHCGESRRFVTA